MTVTRVAGAWAQYRCTGREQGGEETHSCTGDRCEGARQDRRKWLAGDEWAREGKRGTQVDVERKKRRRRRRDRDAEEKVNGVKSS